MGQAAEAEGLSIDSVMDEVAAGMNTGGEGEGAAASSGAAAGGEGAATAEAIEELLMPQSWKKEWEPDWKATPRNSQQRYIEREKQMLAGLETYKGDAGYGKSIREAFKPYADILKAQGVDEVKAITYLLNAHKGLSDPKTQKDWYARLAKSYGIEVAQAAADGAQPDPATKALTDRLERMEGFLTEQQQRDYDARVADTGKQVEAFASDPAHPYFDECSDHIAKLIGAGYSLKDAYEAAVWANPVTRQKELGRLEKERTEEQRKQTAEAAKQAKKASRTNVKGRDTARASTEPAGSMDDTLRETLADIKARI